MARLGQRTHSPASPRIPQERHSACGQAIPTTIYLLRGNHSNIIKATVCECVYVCFLLLHAQTAGPILMKFDMQEADTLH